MFNLLPSDEKNNLYVTYSIRRAILGLLFLLAIGVIMCVSIVPSFILTKAKEVEIVQQVEFLNASLAVRNVDELNKKIIAIRDEVKALKDFTLENQKVSGLFNKILEKKSVDIRITGLLYGTASKKHEIVLNGIAKNREALLAFAQSIGREKIFSNVILPVSNFAKNNNIQFSFSITGDF